MKRYIENCKIRPGAKNKSCATCGKPISRNPNQAWCDVLIVTDIERTSYFRGEDSVEFHHYECIIPPTTKAEGEVGK